MKKIITAVALLMIGASAHAGVYNIDGATIRVQDGCMSSACVSVDAPGYGFYRGGRIAKVHKTRKDATRVASVKKNDAATTSATGSAPPVEANAAKSLEKSPDKVQETAPQAVPVDAAPVK